jgi:nucleoside-diphosphate-sugar epimerase
LAKILVTGGAGYVGSGLLRTLLERGDEVVCVDRLSFGGESLLDIWHHRRFRFEHCDIGNAGRMDSIIGQGNFDAVIHLAAIVGDPACKLEPEEALRTNWTASKELLDRCLAAGVSRFIFASTCSNYGRSEPGTFVHENSPLAPVSLYAELKVRFERYLLEGIPRQAGFCPTALRFSTVYGVSPRMRFDLTVNEFTKELALGRELVVFGEQFWRPYCHVRDFARAFVAVLDAPADDVAYDVFNVGQTDQNYTKQMLVEEIARQIPTAKIRYVKRDEDPRDYRVNFDKIHERLGFSVTQTVPDGIREVAEIVSSGVISEPDHQRYYNIPVNRSSP